MQVTSDVEDATVNPSGTGEKAHLFYPVVIDQGHLYTHLIGTFPLRSSKGNWDVMVL
jgi:hypothetical protein